VDPVSLASALIAAQTGQTQQALMAELLKMDAQNAKSIVALIESAQGNVTQAALGPGQGQNLDITV